MLKPSWTLPPRSAAIGIILGLSLS
ncbi:CRISPR-associated protein Cas5 [Acinetobacter pittii]